MPINRAAHNDARWKVSHIADKMRDLAIEMREVLDDELAHVSKNTVRFNYEEVLVKDPANPYDPGIETVTYSGDATSKASVEALRTTLANAATAVEAVSTEANALRGALWSQVA